MNQLNYYNKYKILDLFGVHLEVLIELTSLKHSRFFNKSDSLFDLFNQSLVSVNGLFLN